MERMCKRGRDFVQVYNAEGAVRLCSWIKDGCVGNLIDNSLPEVFHGEKAKRLRQCLLRQDYSQCRVDECPYLMTGEINDLQTELGNLPQYPEELYLAFENICNYRCKSCTICRMNAEKTKEELEQNYDIIEDRVRQAMPYVKRISANGLGELFVSKRILKLLYEWRPKAPAAECSVMLETNGSLFDEEHWKQIENLGKYKLNVAITIMSFEESVYQHLSGVNYPIEKIENNLRYVKKLREKGIIDFLTIATVVQAENFRTLPQFAYRCIEEFGADFVRLRPYDNWGGQNEMEEFFMNIRNPKHPWHQEYKETMKHPYLSHPKVHDQSGGENSYGMRTVPYELSDLKWRILTEIINNPNQIIQKLSEMNNPVIYGMGNLTAALVREMNLRNMPPLCIIDAYKKSGNFEGIPVYNIKEVKGLEEKEVSVIVTPVADVQELYETLNKYGIHGKRIPIWDIIGDRETAERLKYINRL